MLQDWSTQIKFGTDVPFRHHPKPFVWRAFKQQQQSYKFLKAHLYWYKYDLKF